MRVFRFDTELFSYRAIAQEALSARGCEWLVHYTSIDLLQEEFGVEVCGCPTEAQAQLIEQILRTVFPSWTYSSVRAHIEGGIDQGWKAVIHRDPEPPDPFHGLFSP